MFLENLNPHPRDDLIKFTEKDHTYKINKIKYTSVTTIISSLFEPFNEEEIISNMLSKNYDKTHKYYNKNKKEIKQMWCDTRNLGTELHKYIEYYLNNMSIEEYKNIEFNYFLNFMNLYQLEPYRTEFRIYDEEYEIAGSVDAIFKDNDKYIVCDWKRVSDIDQENRWNKFSYVENVGKLKDTKYLHYQMQLNLYAYILEKNYNMKISKLIIVLIHPDNENFVLHSVNFKKNILEKILKNKKK